MLCDKWIGKPGSERHGLFVDIGVAFPELWTQRPGVDLIIPESLGVENAAATKNIVGDLFLITRRPYSKDRRRCL